MKRYRFSFNSPTLEKMNCVEGSAGDRSETLHRKRAVDGASLQCKPFTKGANFNHFLRSLFFSVIHPSLTKPQCYCYTPRAQLLSGLIKRSRQILATVNKSSGQRSLFTPPRKFICYALWSSFRSL